MLKAEMKVIQTPGIYFTRASLMLLAGLIGATAKGHSEARICDAVAIEDVEEVGIWHDKITRVARGGGLIGSIDYVIIITPQSPAQARGIRQMRVWRFGNRKVDTKCVALPPIAQRPAISCSNNLPGTELRLQVVFEPEATGNLEKRTSDLVKYVLKDVFCKLEHE